MSGVNGHPPPRPLDPETARALEAIWTQLSDEIAGTGVVCRQSGNCCNFDQWEHVPCATTLELRHLLSRNDGSAAGESGRLCTFWKDRRCTAHTDRPTGCRVFYCDLRYIAEDSQRLYEKYHEAVKELCIRAREPYVYVPMVPAMREWATKGRWFDPQDPMALWRDHIRQG